MAATSGLVSNVFPPLPFLLENSRVSLVSRNDHNASGIDLEKVKALMGQMQIDSLPQGAKDLMRVMEHHQLSSTIQNQGHLTSTAITSGPASQPLSISAHDISSSDTMPSEPATNKTAKEQIVYATKADLAQMEARIMTTIDHRLQELEDRILSKLLNAKQR
ncbi:hypothetical protein BCR41DRAFT_360492 [Lobosporangium transversale]|uniref:Uncharacterized protein n=1 Tax=Lobosporangium transversale TaxID=64571 RepID=A0A1Y2GCJ8_9FUNG|nr:hypothetical protein BCR41DRAFT_360492 [Lobosporangium transversale]ORZ07019.1 hypothetical protein BCR41DRAFT_360492 [Lobosporangium transversale]|eukprot:XP_021877815.1 hypothetical protein BCR41DRAFT_360492 [Lobosporangium transversale]